MRFFFSFYMLWLWLILEQEQQRQKEKIKNTVIKQESTLSVIQRTKLNLNWPSIS